MILFWLSKGVNTKNVRNPKRKRTRKRSKGVIKTSSYKITKNGVHSFVGNKTVRKDRSATPVHALSVPVLPPDTPSVSKVSTKVLNEPMDDSEEIAVLDTVIQMGKCVCDQAEFELTEENGPALRYTTKTGVALTPIRMPSLSEDGNECPDDIRNNLAIESCKSVQYVCVDGKAGLTVHPGCRQLWTAIELTPKVV